MQRTLFNLFVYPLTLLATTTVLAQPVTTAAAVRFGEVSYNYDFPLESESRLTIGPDMAYDFTSYGDLIINFGTNDDPQSAPARDVPVSELLSFSLFAIDQAYRDTLDVPLPQNLIGLDIQDVGSPEIIRNIQIMEVKESGLYQVAGRFSYQIDGQVVDIVLVDSSEELAVPLGLAYGERFDTTISYLSEEQVPGIIDSFIQRTTVDYAGYGTLTTWTGLEESVGGLVVTLEEESYYAKDDGSYGQPDLYSSTSLYLMSEASVIPRAVIVGDYDTTSRVFVTEFLSLALPTSEEPTTTVRTSGIPGSAIAIFPNPTRGAFGVDLTVDRATSLSLELYTATGQRLIYRAGLSVTPGLNRLPVSAEGLPAGLYFLNLTLADGRSETRRVVVE